MIKYLIMDVDGTLTDGKVYMGNKGEIFKAFSIKDGYGIHDILIPNGILPIVVTGRNSKIVKKRCKELGISNVYQGIKNKEDVVIRITDNLAEVAYMGDDLNDLPIMNTVKKNGGIIGCPYDAIEEVKCIADFISKKNGGDGAVRDFIEWIIK